MKIGLKIIKLLYFEMYHKCMVIVSMYVLNHIRYINSIVIYQREEVELPSDALLEDNAKLTATTT